MQKYSLTIQWSDEDGGYIALVPEFPGLSACGRSWLDAAAQAMVALEGQIAVFEEDGTPLPEPITLGDANEH